MRVEKVGIDLEPMKTKRMKPKSLVYSLAVAACATGVAALASSCQNTGPHPGPHRGPAQVMRDTHRQNVQRHRSFHEGMADRHERAFGFRPPTPPGMRSGY